MCKFNIVHTCIKKYTVAVQYSCKFCTTRVFLFWADHASIQFTNIHKIQRYLRADEAKGLLVPYVLVPVRRGRLILKLSKFFLKIQKKSLLRSYYFWTEHDYEHEKGFCVLRAGRQRGRGRRSTQGGVGRGEKERGEGSAAARRSRLDSPRCSCGSGCSGPAEQADRPDLSDRPLDDGPLGAEGASGPLSADGARAARLEG